MYMISDRYRYLTPSKKIVDLVTNTFSTWWRLEYARLFNWYHPNKKGNELFAKEIKKPLFDWIKSI